MRHYFKFTANKEAGTKGDQQTPVHFAAKNNSCKSLQVLINQGCEYKTVVDYKGRTPLLLASELGERQYWSFQIYDIIYYICYNVLLFCKFYCKRCYSSLDL